MTDGHFDLANKRIWVAGHGGMVGAALVQQLRQRDCEILTVARGALDLRRQAEVEGWMRDQRPNAVFIAAARVGGILANDSRPAEFIYDNLAITQNIIHGAHLAEVSKLMFLGSACIYPRLADQPMEEAALLTGPLEPTNEWYAIAKIAGIKLCQAYRRQYGRDFISVIPTNLFGPGDNFDPAASHVVPAMIRKIGAAKASEGTVEIWGTGAPRREFLYVDDAAAALIFLMEHYSDEDIINVGGGEDISIADLAKLVAQVIGFEGEFVYATDKPDGMPRKRLAADRLLDMGWRPQVSLLEGIRRTCDWIHENAASARLAATS